MTNPWQTLTGSLGASRHDVREARGPHALAAIKRTPRPRSAHIASVSQAVLLTGVPIDIGSQSTRSLDRRVASLPVDGVRGKC